MAALEAEFQFKGSVFCKHFGKEVKDQQILGGLSWEELTGISRDTFNRGFNQIGITYRQEDVFEMDDDTDEFGDLFYGRLKTHHKKRTYYYRSKLVASLLKDYEESLRNNSGQSNNQELALAK